MMNNLFNKFAFLVILSIAVTSISGKFKQTFIPCYFYHHQTIKKNQIKNKSSFSVHFVPSSNIEHKNKLTMQLKVHFYADIKQEMKMFIWLFLVCECVYVWNVLQNECHRMF